jgi:hypothetical protein
MSVFIRSILGVVLVIGLSVVIGCTSAQSGGKTAAKPNNPFSWTKKEPEGASKTTMGEFIARPKPTVVR